MAKATLPPPRVYSCERCKATLAKEDRRRRVGQRMVAVEGEMIPPSGERIAPVVRCKKCGLRTVMLTGSL